MNAHCQPLRLVLVDDHPLVRTGIRTSLQHNLGEVRIEEAGHAAAALALIATHRPHLVLLDVNLPGVNGLDLARQIRALNHEVKLLMVAADADPWTVNEAIEAGASGFVAKTNSGNLLPEAVRSVLAGKVFLCPDSQAALLRAEPSGNTGAEPPGPAVLSQREREVLRCLAHGENTKTIATLLRISPKTVETHRQHIQRKLGTSSVAFLTRYAIRHGLTTV
jgi:DNA-binding NarL/FixJ family response regulator